MFLAIFIMLIIEVISIMSTKEKYTQTRISDPEEYILREEEKESYDTSYEKEKAFIVKKYGVRGNQIEIEPHHPCGDICIFIDGSWAGYIDEEFALCMEKDIDPRDYPKVLSELYGIHDYE